ncbi:MAG TPA: haloacid dehalogenase type II [Rhizobiaceae bacterium]|nr:haloacid dehalogenase type II [Rhizobiaceae bacterium]
MAVEALIFDVFGTCVDWRTGVAKEVSRMAGAKGLAIDAASFADAWRGRYQPAMQEIRAGRRFYVELDVLHRENLDATLTAFSIDDHFNNRDRAELNRAWEKLPPWPDVVPGLSRLKPRFIIAPCSNGSIALMTRLAKYGGLPWDCVLGAGIARAYKPDPQAYLASCAALQLAPKNVMMVAAHNSDLEAARHAGLMTAFIPRPDEFGDGSAERIPSSGWNHAAEDFQELASQLGC